MAKRDKPTGLKAGTSVKRAMRAILPPQVKTILGYEAAVRKRDPDAVHDMRVGTKRLREAARVFRPAFGKTRMTHHLAHVEALNNALGKVRELDVMLEQLADLAGRDPLLESGLKPLQEKLAAERVTADEALTPVLDETLPCLEEDFASLLKDRCRRLCHVWQMPMVDLGRESLASRLAETSALEEAARPPESILEFHRLRIAFKKVKYALELFLPIVGKRARTAYQPVSELQELMGRVHDCDVLLAKVTEAKGGLLKAAVANRASKLLHSERDALHTQTISLLDEMHTTEVLEKLLRKLGVEA